MSKAVDRAAEQVYRGIWHGLVKWFKVPDEPPTLPTSPGEQLERFKPAEGFLRYLLLFFWIGLVIDAFSLARHEWLRHFFDVRSELAHYNTPLPIASEQKIIIEFRNPSTLEMYKKGRYEIGFNAILSYAPALFAMLDAWAMAELKNVDPEASLTVVHETGWKKPLEVKNITVSALLSELGV